MSIKYLRVYCKAIIVSFVLLIISSILHSQSPALLKDIRTGAGNSTPQELVNAGGILFFSATNGANGIELWKSDGTTAGTILVKDINPSGSSNPQNLVCVNGIVYFMAIDGTNGYELWKSDGTTAGTVMVKDINNGAGNANPGNLTNVNGVLFFTATDGTNGIELWKSDGTTSGTVTVKDIYPGNNSSQPQYLCNVTGVLFFTATDGINGVELWKSDGTTAGTIMVKNIRAGGTNSNPANITNINGTAFFSADDGTSGIELWKSDGTSAGTVLVLDINAGGVNSSPAYLTDVNGVLIFAANKSGQGVELWKSDGTAGGTTLVKDIRTGASGSNPTDIVNVNGTVFFSATDGLIGIELWKSDGTTAGTVLVKDIKPGGAASSSSPSQFCNLNGFLYFQADDGTLGVELWKTDGTTAGTSLVSDIKPGGTNSNPINLICIDGVLYFQADDGTSGKELWKLTYCGSYSLAGTVGGSTVSAKKLINSLPITFYENSTCNLLVSITPSGTNFISSNVTSSVKIDASVQICNGTPYLQRHYDIIPDINAATSTATITLYFKQSEFDTYNTNNGTFPDLPINASDAIGISNITITQFHGTSVSGLPGTYSGAAELIDPTDANIIWNTLQSRWEISFAVSGFSGFFLSTSQSILPLTYIQAEAHIVNDASKLDWTITEPENIDHFIVEKSTDRVNYSGIATIPAEPNKIKYQFSEVLGTQDRIYYRIKVVLRNGGIANSRILTIKKPESKLTLKLFPNPADDKLFYISNERSNTSVDVSVYSLDGKLLLHEMNSGIGNQHNFINVQTLKSGSYFIKIIDRQSGTQLSSKFSILR